jgi:hypothetical protein
MERMRRDKRLFQAVVLAVFLLNGLPGQGNPVKAASQNSRVGVSSGLSYGHLFMGKAGIGEIKKHIKGNAQLLEELGVGLNRLHNWHTFKWDSIERRKGQFDWDLSDHVVRTGQEHHLDYIGTIYLVSLWGTSRPYVPRDWKDYRDFVTKIVERYDGDGVDDMSGLTRPIKYWEIENEPAAPFAGMQVGMSPETYMDILTHGYGAIKEADPEAKVLLAGQDLPAYFERLMDLGAGNYFDIMNYHFYSYDPEDRDIEEAARRFEQIMQKKAPQKPVWLTETAACSRIRKGLAVKDLIQSQARAAVKIPVVSFASGVDKVFWHTLRDGPDIFSDGPALPEGVVLGGGEAYYSLVQFEGYGGKRKPAFYTYRLLGEKIGSFRSVKTLGQGIYQFRFEDKKPVHVLWSNGAKTVDLSQHVGSPGLTLTHIIEEEGETAPKTETVPANEVPVTESPVFVEEVEGRVTK